MIDSIVIPEEEIEKVYTYKAEGKKYCDLLDEPWQYADFSYELFPYIKTIADKINLTIESHPDKYNDNTGADYNPNNNLIRLFCWNESALLHELSHALHHNVVGEIFDVSRTAAEVIAELSVYIVENYLGYKGNNMSHILYVLNEVNLDDSRLKTIISDYQDKILKIVNTILDAMKEVGYEKIPRVSM